MIEVDARKEIGEYIFVSKYAKTLPNGKKETWGQAVQRVLDMHRSYYLDKLSPENKVKFEELLDEVAAMYQQKRILGAQRALQYGGELMLEKHARLYNCSSTYIDRIEVFEELVYLLLCGAGTGYSVQRCHTEKLPVPMGFNQTLPMAEYRVPDTIEGWAKAFGMLIENYYNGGPDIEFDYSGVRPKGAYIRGGFKAPGPEPLRIALAKVRECLLKINGRKLRPFELHYIICVMANCVVTGGVRRSAMISIFDADDREMVNCKTGNWIAEKPELCRSNNSAAILPTTSKETFNKIFESTQKYGEPGFVFIESPDYVFNPCAEVQMYPKYKDEFGVEHTGWGFCNLCEINGGKITTEDDFYKACRAAAILCTIQAGYTSFGVLKKWSSLIAQRDALIGVGITGICEVPEILLNPAVQQRGAIIVREVNKEVASVIGINAAARCTVVKPSGNSSQLLGTLSGITPGHSLHYIRHIQAADTEQAVAEWEQVNPQMVEPSVWAKDREKVIAFPVTLPKKSLIRKKITAVQFLEMVLLTKRNWIEAGTNLEHPSTLANPKIRMNVSNTCTVGPDEWFDVREFLWKNREDFGGVSLLSSYGDLDYPQAPFTEVLDEKELADKYGAGAILSSGLIVDGCKVFSSIWEACNAALGLDDNLLKLTDVEVGQFVARNIVDGKFLVEVDGICFSDVNAVISHLKKKVQKRIDWVRRFNQFAERYMGGDKQQTAYCLKSVNNYHKWQKLCKEMRPLDYSEIRWNDVPKEAGSDIATACAGGACEIPLHK